MSIKFRIIDAERQGQRIDNYLFSQLKGVPKTRIYRALRQGEVRVNGKRIKADYRLVDGDKVRIPPLRQSSRVTDPEAPSAHIVEQLADCVLYEDNQLLIIDKPARLPVHGGTGIQSGLIEALRFMRPQCASLELVHRLDRETSGCLIIAKKRQVLRELHQLLLTRKVQKQYLCLVAGRWPDKTVAIDAPLLKNQLQSGERVVCVNQQGKPAITRFKPLRYYEQATLMQVVPVTGRTHQIRVHAAYAGHPIAGDAKYGSQQFNRYCKRLGLGRLFLHSASIGFHLAENKQKFSLCACLPSELHKVIAQLSATS